MNKSSLNTSLRDAFLEALFIVIGVALAYGVNEWREARNSEQRAATARHGIVEELKTNLAAAKSSHQYHTMLMDTLSKMVRSNAQSGKIGTAAEVLPEIMLFRRGFISPATVFSTAFETAKNANILQAFAYEDALLISRVYSVQSSYEMQVEYSGELVYKILFEEGKDGLLANYKNLAQVIGTFVYKEKVLMDTYRNALEELDAPVSQ